MIWDLIEPGAAGWEGRTLPLCYAAPRSIPSVLMEFLWCRWGLLTALRVWKAWICRSNLLVQVLLLIQHQSKLNSPILSKKPQWSSLTLKVTSAFTSKRFALRQKVSNKDQKVQILDFSVIFVCGHRPKDQGITWIAVVFVVALYLSENNSSWPGIKPGSSGTPAKHYHLSYSNICMKNYLFK